MSKNIKIKIGDIELKAVLNDSLTAKAIGEALPITASFSTWGNEIYFSIPVKLDLEKGQEVVGMGDLGYWPPGNAFCIFYGTTPMSRGPEIRPASTVTVFGKVTGDVSSLKKVSSGDQILIEGETE